MRYNKIYSPFFHIFSSFLLQINIIKYFSFFFQNSDLFNSNITYRQSNSHLLNIIFHRRKRRKSYSKHQHYMRSFYILRNFITTVARPYHYNRSKFSFFYSDRFLRRNLNNLLVNYKQVSVRKYKFRFLINKVKPTPEILIYRNNDIRVFKLINYIFFFKSLTNKPKIGFTSNFWAEFLDHEKNKIDLIFRY